MCRDMLTLSHAVNDMEHALKHEEDGHDGILAGRFQSVNGSDQ